ncbi:MAG: hypothetical protein WCF73_08220 [Candidatus Sulfotelmatobacter sp.]
MRSANAQVLAVAPEQVEGNKARLSASEKQVPELRPAVNFQAIFAFAYFFSLSPALPLEVIMRILITHPHPVGALI